MLIILLEYCLADSLYFCIMRTCACTALHDVRDCFVTKLQVNVVIRKCCTYNIRSFVQLLMMWLGKYFCAISRLVFQP